MVTPGLCCISHAFCQIAWENLSKISVVHATGGARLLHDSWEKEICDGYNEEELFRRHRVSSSPPLYEGDECFRFRDVLAAVEFISCSIGRILDAGDCDDSDLIKPKGYSLRNLMQQTESLDASTSHGTCEAIRSSRSHHVQKIVGVYIVQSVEYIVAVLSVLRCGAIFLPLDPSWPKDRLLSIVHSAQAVLVMTSSFTLTVNGVSSDWLAEQMNCLIFSVIVKRKVGECFIEPEPIVPCAAKHERICYVIYTSGSTGTPKGACGTEEGLLNRFAWMQNLYPLQSQDVLIFKTSISFIDHIQEFLSAVLSGSPLIIPSFIDIRKGPFFLLGYLKAYDISRLTTIPSVMRGILRFVQGQLQVQLQKTMQMLVLSGEPFHLSLFNNLSEIFPRTCVLNLYGSTEVSGDCTYFDCKNLSQIIKENDLSTVPIGLPISNCDIILVGESGISSEGEIYVGGSCVSRGYLSDTAGSLSECSDYVKLDQGGWLIEGCSRQSCPSFYFRTGDFARKLSSGEFVFTGRKDRLVKLNGQRVAPEEIECVLRGHPDVVDAAVLPSRNAQKEISYLEAYIVLRKNKFWDDKRDLYEELGPMFRNWLINKLPPVMLPTRYTFMEFLPVSSSGKINYALLERSASGCKCAREEIVYSRYSGDCLQSIREVFCGALMVEEVADNDDFFVMGGNSVMAAQVAYKLRIDVRLLYIFPTPSKLLNALLYKKVQCADKSDSVTMITSHENTTVVTKNQRHTFAQDNYNLETGDFPKTLADYATRSESLQSGVKPLSYDSIWNFYFHLPASVSLSRCNRVMWKSKAEMSNISYPVDVPRLKYGHMEELWAVLAGSCVDASPLVVFKGKNAYLFIGSHSHMFFCVNALSGLVQWQIKLEGRIECSAAVTDDFTLVVVGCYGGKIYFIDILNGELCWSFQTGGEVKSQPVADRSRSLIWCGSHDHNLYALDYKNCCVVAQISCRGSIYGQPLIDEIGNRVYVASTSGHVTAISTQGSLFSVLWTYEADAPIFGSLSMIYNGNVICCMVDGQVIALNSNGSIVWKASTEGPIFSGGCISYSLPFQVLICSRNGCVYSFDLESGKLLWEYDVGDPITSSAYIDENILLISDISQTAERLVCICGSSGGISVLRVQTNLKEGSQPDFPVVQKFASMHLPGNIFSSPVMIGGQIFVGCRDDYIHCVRVVL